MTIKCKLISERKTPRSGTKLRLLYDILMKSPGVCVHIPIKDIGVKKQGHISRMLEDLVNYYNLDVRLIGAKGNDRAKYGSKQHRVHLLLAGEWINKAYIDYVLNPNIVNGRAGNVDISHN